MAIHVTASIGCDLCGTLAKGVERKLASRLPLSETPGAVTATRPPKWVEFSFDNTDFGGSTETLYRHVCPECVEKIKKGAQ